jgi:superfamily I DNA/RNA helicase
MKQNRIKVFGPPGTGKTTWCLETLGHHLEAGDKVLFVAFTRAAADEGKDRLRAKFGEVPANATCSTIHSLCLRLLGIPKDCLFDQKFVKWKFYQTIDRMGLSNDKIAATLELYNRLRNEEAYDPTVLDYAKNHGDMSDIYDSIGLKQLFIDRYEQYKTQDARVDFTDLLSRVANGEGTIPQYDVVIIDEAQDLTMLQWRVMERVCASSPHTVYAVGDDDQSVYEFMGAAVMYFLSWPCTSLQVLEETYRLPQNFLDYSIKFAERIHHRQAKKIHTSISGNGIINEGSITDFLPFYRYATELYLVRNKYMLKRVQGLMALNGFPYKGKDSLWMRRDVQSIASLLAWRTNQLSNGDWKRLRYYMPPDLISKLETLYPAVAERGSEVALPALDKLFKPAFFEDAYDQWWRRFYPNMPNELKLTVMKGFREFGVERSLHPTLELSTVHGAKGKEADCVYLCSGLTEKLRRLADSEDTEHRVFYVGATRAKKELVLISDIDNSSQYPFPKP